MKIGILLSGGVDSSVVLAELASEKKHDLKAYYLKIWLEDELSYLGDCPWEQDLEYARAVCDQFNVPLEIVPLQTEYHERVVSYTLSELKKGLTPSPDIFCNQMIKFGAFWERVANEVDIVASGHYATTVEVDGVVKLQQGVDLVKDQSYFLSFLSQEQLKRCYFSLGKYEKSEVRELAQRFDLPTKDRKDSQGICFLGKIKYNDFVEFHLGEKIGKIVDIDTGKALGEHRGYWYHTVGQRKGLGLGSGPWYVMKKDVKENIVYVRHANKEVSEFGYEFNSIDPNWISGRPNFSNELSVKLRHGPGKIKCKVEQKADGVMRVRLSEPDKGLADGQFSVFYDGSICLGAAKILSL